MNFLSVLSNSLHICNVITVTIIHVSPLVINQNFVEYRLYDHTTVYRMTQGSEEALCPTNTMLNA